MEEVPLPTTSTPLSGFGAGDACYIKLQVFGVKNKAIGSHFLLLRTKINCDSVKDMVVNLVRV